MIERLALDTNAVADLLRRTRPDPPGLHQARAVFLPLIAAGELFGGAYISRDRERNLAELEGLITSWTVLSPDLETARIYGRLRATHRESLSVAKLNDLWIAALCLQHNLPLLTNDRGFDTIPGLTVLHW